LERFLDFAVDGGGSGIAAFLEVEGGGPLPLPFPAPLPPPLLPPLLLPWPPPNAWRGDIKAHEWEMKLLTA
jgi:hypothetical protein